MKVSLEKLAAGIRDAWAGSAGRLAFAELLSQVGQDRQRYARSQRNKKPGAQPHEEVKSVLHLHPLFVFICL